MTISEGFEAYRIDCIVFRNQSAKTEENHLIAMKSLVEFLHDKDIEQMTFEDIRAWKQHLDKGRCANTVRNYVIKLRVVLAHLRQKGYKVVHPDLVPVAKRVQTVPSFVSAEDVQKLIETVGRPQSGYSVHNRLRNKAIVSFLYASGLRVSELCRLNREDLTQDTFTVVGKGGKARICFIDQRTRMMLFNYLRHRKDNHPALFISDASKDRITCGTVQEIFKTAWKKAGFTKPIHPHVLRHSYATNLLRNNANLRYVQMLLGHESIQTTQMYTHVVDNDLRRVYLEHHSV